MNVLVIGSGGREHALAWKIKQSPLVDALHCAPGNPGMAQIATCIDIKANETDALIAYAKENAIDLTVVGPEDPLADGIVDRFAEAGLKAFGPSQSAAQLEASKQFAKDFMERHNIPTAAHRTFDDADAAIAYVKEVGAPIVVKADGLAAGKGVTVALDVDQAIEAIRSAMLDGAFGGAGARVVVEEFMEGEEASIFCLSDGESWLTLASSQDHKAAYDGDRGPNTGGMGAYSPAPVVTADIMQTIEDSVLAPAIRGMASEGAPYKGVLYAGLMIADEGARVVEFNCRFGDPETQVVMPRMASDIVPLLLATIDGTISDTKVEWNEGSCVSVVMASGGYPGAYEKGKSITGIADAESAEGTIVFHAGTRTEDSDLQTNGGRVLNVTALAPDTQSAIAKAYKAVEKIAFEGAQYRTDIAYRAVGRE